MLIQNVVAVMIVVQKFSAAISVLVFIFILTVIPAFGPWIFTDFVSSR